MRTSMWVKRVLCHLLTLCLTVVPVLAQAEERITYIHNDALGSPVAATDQNGQLLWSEEYAPYGERLLQQDTTSNAIGYTGKQDETALDVQYFGARWYHPEIGIFLARDPVGFNEGNVHSFNRYTYANNNPYKYVDPDGKSSIKLSDLKRALKEVHEKLGGKLPQGREGSFGSSQHGDSVKGYRLDKEGHPNAPPGTPDHDGPHINWWDFSKMKKKEAKRKGLENEVSGAVRVGDTAKNAANSIIGAGIAIIEALGKNFPNTIGIIEGFDPVSISERAVEAGIIPSHPSQIAVPPEV